MIYTCTFNPSLDYYLEFKNDIELNKTNRSNIEYYEAGGKGINVSIVLSNLAIPSRALGFIGGFNKDFFLSILSRHRYLEPYFVYIEGHTRINVKAVCNGVTEFNATGPYIDYESKQQMLSRTKRIDENDIIVVSGNIQDHLQDFTEELIVDLKAQGTEFVVDTDASMANRLIKHKPLLLKPNLAEINDIFNTDKITADNVIEYAKKLHGDGVQNVIVSLGALGSVMVNKYGVYRAGVLEYDVVNPTGAGDSMIAGFIFNIQRGFNEVNAYKYAACCGLATTYGDGLATKEKIDRYFDEFEIEVVEEYRV